MSGTNKNEKGDLTTTEMTNKKIDEIFTSMSRLVQAKNTNYGNVAAEPINIFGSHVYKDNPPGLNTILIRLDDKLSRIKNAGRLRKNDVSDLMGYVALLCSVEDWTNFDEFID